MPNSWFNPSGKPATRAFALSSDVRLEFAAIGGAFERMPNPLLGNAKGFSGGEWQSALLTNPTIGGGIIGSIGNPSIVNAGGLFITGNGYAAGGFPVSPGTIGAFFRVANTNRVGYARSNTNTPTPGLSFFMDEYRNLVMGAGDAENATSTTDGFFYLPTVNGAPTGTPSGNYTGAAPAVVDRANNRLYVRVGGSWRYAALT